MLVDASSDHTFVKLLTRYETGASERRDSLEKIASELGGKPKAAPNIWMRAVLDDAARDIKTVAPGPLLDIALAGAMRKGAQASRVSVETVLALCKQQKRSATAIKIAAMRNAHASTDRKLAARLKKLASDL